MFGIAAKSKNTLTRLKGLWEYRELVVQLTLRDLLSRYKGSYLGFLWAVLNPLLMLFVYSFIFIVVFKLKWGSSAQSGRALYTLMIYGGLIPFYIFSESVNRSIGLISGSPNYVKKVVFPLEVLPISTVFSIVINNLISLVLLVIGKLLFLHTPNWSLILFPLIILPLLLISLGLALFFSALGVYVKDLTHTVALLMNVLFYMSPIFYQASAVPQPFRSIIEWNPLTPMIEQWRSVFLLGNGIDISSYLTSLVSALCVLMVGYVTFLVLRKGFSDVI